MASPTHDEGRHHPEHPHTHGGDGSGAGGEHTEAEDHAWQVEIPDHPARTESEDFRAAKTVEHKILATVRAEPGGCELLAAISADGATQAHHAGSLWVFTDGAWRLLLNICGVEWSAQFAAEPQRVDALRQNAQWLYQRFPESLDELERLGYHQARAILSEPITDHVGVARWTDSLFNSCVPLTAALHQAILSPAHPQTGGWHHYPKPIWDQQITKRADFNLWVTDPHGYPAAVAPMAHRGSGDARVRVIYSHPSSPLHAEHLAHEAAGEEHVLEAGHDMAQQAFAGQA